MAFSAAELLVLRRALTHALAHPEDAHPDDLGDYLRLAASIEEATAEAGRMRAFRLDELGRYRGALPGSAVGYLDLLEDALNNGYVPLPEDHAALRDLLARPCAPSERLRRSDLLARCRRVVPPAVRRPAPRPVRPAPGTPRPLAGVPVLTATRRSRAEAARRRHPAMPVLAPR
ncbi:hypothetical protein BIV57_11755 [Mangrovactinospora gilvigrisea]|uniref:Uncharacterized protein n=2 Tax=Mangrovactinospora gilvigrisea TaxID=1428644 RepID=A0A1J7C703_9ACTN|nr:hypothetical protein BIV57_11755 [Mangrovactinospora gilvigrisea]